jgi:multidrug efflux pump subunit AcrB
MAVLIFVLGVRTAPFVGLAIPLSMLLSFSIIRFVGFSMNMVVLFSLILALGMLVDNAIVVVENIYRFRERRFDRVRAAKYATAEVAVPIIASTATTLAAFFPMTFWPGIVGEFMKYLPLTLIITLSSSLFVALVILPTLAARMLDTEDAPVGMTQGLRRVLIGAAVLTGVVLMFVNPLTATLLLVTGAAVYGFHHYVGHPAGHWLMTKGLPRFIERYEVVLRWALNHRWRMVGGAAGALIVAVMLFGVFNAGVEFFPENVPPTTAYIQVEAPLGTRLEEADRIARQLESEVAGIEGREEIPAERGVRGRAGDPPRHGRRQLCGLRGPAGRRVRHRQPHPGDCGQEPGGCRHLRRGAGDGAADWFAHRDRDHRRRCQGPEEARGRGGVDPRGFVHLRQAGRTGERHGGGPSGARHRRGSREGGALRTDHTGHRLDHP